MKFSEDELKKLAQLAELYKRAKAIVLFAEEVDPNSRSNLQVIKEFRDAFDHLMGLLADKTRAGEGEKGDSFGVENIEKAIGHVFRAAFDALDGTVLSLKEKIVKMLDDYSQDDIVEVMKDYWDLRKEIQRIEGQVAAHRSKKDVSEKIGEVFDDYVKDVAKLGTIHERFLESGSLIAEQSRIRRRKEFRDVLKNILIGILIGVISTLVTVSLISSSPEHSTNSSKPGNFDGSFSPSDSSRDTSKTIVK